MWKIEYYETQSGRIPVMEFIDNLPVAAQVKVRNSFRLLEEFGIRLPSPHSKKIKETKLYELRVLGQNSLRILYFPTEGKKFVILHGFRKKTQKILGKELKIAERRLEDYLERKT